MSLILFIALIDSFSLITHGQFQTCLIWGLACHIALANMNYFAWAFRVVIRGEVVLCLRIEHQIVAQGWDGHLLRLDSAQLLRDEEQDATDLFYLIRIVSGFALSPFIHLHASFLTFLCKSTFIDLSNEGEAVLDLVTLLDCWEYLYNLMLDWIRSSPQCMINLEIWHLSYRR